MEVGPFAHFRIPFLHDVPKSHVYRHLRPYICTSNECKTPFKAYATRHEWFEHEAQIHRRQWFCHAWLLMFGDQVAFVKRQRTHRADTFADWQLPALNDLFSRPADRDVLDTCPLCSKPGQLIRRHLAYHMRKLSFHILPKGGMGDDPIQSMCLLGIHPSHQANRIYMKRNSTRRESSKKR